MNTIQEISLMLVLGIDPATEIDPELLRAMWLEKLAEEYGPARKAGAKLCASQQGVQKSREKSINGQGTLR